jgi:hypothetical protein
VVEGFVLFHGFPDLLGLVRGGQILIVVLLGNSVLVNSLVLSLFVLLAFLGRRCFSIKVGVLSISQVGDPGYQGETLPC